MNCPICEKPTTNKDNPFRPFCSERCKLIDFGHWMDENYSVPSDEIEITDAVELEQAAEHTARRETGDN